MEHSWASHMFLWDIQLGMSCSAASGGGASRSPGHEERQGLRDSAKHSIGCELTHLLLQPP